MDYSYNGERFLDVLYTQLYKSEEVEHTKESKDTKEESIKRYMDRLEYIHSKANTQNKKDLIKKLYFDKYVIKKENLPLYMYDTNKEGIIESQKKSLSTWIDYLTDENAVYPMWAKYWVFQQMLKMGTYDEVNGKYTKRTKNTVNPFIEVNPEVIAKCIGNLTALLGNEKLSSQQIRKLVSNISFEKMYIEYQKNIKEQYKSNEGIWIKYNQDSKEDAKKLALSLEGHNTGWCTASESTAIAQLCGLNGYGGGDFYVYYTKDEEGNYKIPRIAIRLNGHTNIGEIRGIEEHQNLEEEMIPILESKLNEMKFLSKEDVNKYIKKIDNLKELESIRYKTINNIKLTSNEIYTLYTNNFGFGFESSPLQEKIMKRRSIKDDFNSLEDKKLKIQFLIKLNKELRTNMVIEEFVSNREIILEAVKINGMLIQYATNELKDDKEIVLIAVKNDGAALHYVSENMKNDEEVVFEAINNFPIAICKIGEKLKNNKKFILKLIRYGFRI